MVRFEHENIEDVPSYPTTCQQVVAILQTHLEQLKQFGVTQISLFGSVTRRSLEPQSDVDMIVEFSETTYRRFVDLKLFLEYILGRKVDILTPPAVQGRLKEEIEKDLVHVPT